MKKQLNTRDAGRAGRGFGRWARRGLVLGTALALCACVDTGFEDAALASAEQAQTTRDGVRVMSLNIRVDKDKEGVDSLATRLPRIKKLIASYQPDILGLQELQKKNWEEVRDALDDYTGVFENRNGPVNGKEGAAILVRKGRFNWLDDNENTFSRDERRDEGDCRNRLGVSENRNVVRVKLEDRRTNEIIDVFNTHFPSKHDCEKVGMARLLRDYVHAFGDNVIVMGDFNTGFSKSGDKLPGFGSLTENGYLEDTYDATHDMKNDHAFISDKADTPERLFGNKIDHILVGPAFRTQAAMIDRTMFDGSTRVPCGEAEMVTSADGKERVACRSGQREIPIGRLDVYSDHWAVIADVDRTPCKKHECAPSIK
jgi:endonuclease/exonuclease/phosphatase family metal-dependent hydrolase